jgi:hypothetical protein
LMGLLGAQLMLPKPNMAGAYWETWLSLQESSVRRCGTLVHAYSKRIAQVGGFSSFFIYTLLYIYCLLIIASLTYLSNLTFFYAKYFIPYISTSKYLPALNWDMVWNIFIIGSFLSYYLQKYRVILVFLNSNPPPLPPTLLH